MPESVNSDTGIVYDPRQPDALRAALARSVTLDTRAMGLRAQQQAAQFTFEGMAEQVAAIYAAR